MHPLKTRATIGILGGGQLGRMLALAAARLGLRCHVFCPEADSPAAEVVGRFTQADYRDREALARFSAAADVVTYESENIPAETARFLADRTQVFPDANALDIAQDRLSEKRFITSLGIEVAPFQPISSRAEIKNAVTDLGAPLVLKTRRLGYDGKGQALIRGLPDIDPAFESVGGQACIVEKFVPFQKEIAVVLARGRDGRIECFDIAENEHRNHILEVTRIPAAVPSEVLDEARRIAIAIAQALNYVGCMAVEMFAVMQDKTARVLVNEIAPRVHNCGHWTLDGCSVSQFEQHIRAVAGWPLASPSRLSRRIESTNIIGDEIEHYEQYLDRPSTAVHLYGKTEVRSMRKMGHVTRLFDCPA